MVTTDTAAPAGATNVELIRWAVDRLNAQDLDALRPYWTDTVERFPSQTARGSDAIAGYFAATFAAMPDTHLDIVCCGGEGDDVFLHWKITGHHTGAPFEGIAATGKRVELDGMDHFVVRDGAIASNFVVFDQMQFARAVGLMPPAGSAQDKALKGLFNARVRAARRLKRG